ncbi:MAG: hypothetical protein J6S51_04340 [Kiritimatiellae bacterium]|nr:hypothetical protein [Kiritimatiellia bacterium]
MKNTSRAINKFIFCVMIVVLAQFSTFGFIKSIVGVLPKPNVKFSGDFETMFLSGYLGSSGAIYDTRPNISNCLSLRSELGDGFFIDGYGWFITSLHTLQSDSHRVLLNEFEGSFRFGYDYYFKDGSMLETKAGVLWNPAIGYYNGTMDNWGPYVVQYYKNKFLVPYWDGLWMVSPKRRARVRMGLRKPFKLTQNLSISPFCETVWLDKRRFVSRYNEAPKDHFIRGGALGSITTGFSVTYSLSENLKILGSFSQFDIINSQARRAIKKSDKYYAVCDWPILKIGISYYF